MRKLESSISISSQSLSSRLDTHNHRSRIDSLSSALVEELMETEVLVVETSSEDIKEDAHAAIMAKGVIQRLVVTIEKIMKRVQIRNAWAQLDLKEAVPERLST